MEDDDRVVDSRSSDAVLEVVGPEVEVTRATTAGMSRFMSYVPTGLPPLPRNLDFEGVGGDDIIEPHDDPSKNDEG